MIVHGLLQTEEYVRAPFDATWPQHARESIKYKIQVRLERQELLTRPILLRLWAILDKDVLLRRPGGSRPCEGSSSVSRTRVSCRT